MVQRTKEGNNIFQVPEKLSAVAYIISSEWWWGGVAGGLCVFVCVIASVLLSAYDSNSLFTDESLNLA